MATATAMFGAEILKYPIKQTDIQTIRQTDGQKNIMEVCNITTRSLNNKYIDTQLR